MPEHVPVCAKTAVIALVLGLFCCQADAKLTSPVDAGAAAHMLASPDKGPAHTLPLPEPGEQDLLLLHDDETWRYVAPENPGRLYDAIYFDGRYFVLHGLVENEEKVVISEQSFLSWTRDGLDWKTITLTTEPFQSFTKLASNGESLLLAGGQHIALFAEDKVVTLAALDQNTAPPVMLAYPGGYAIARMDDVVWLDNDGSTEVVLEQQLAQFRAGVAREAGQRSVLTGPFGAFESRDGKHWSALEHAACTGCNVVGMAFGNDHYLASDSLSFFRSSDGAAWDARIFEPAQRSMQGEDSIARVDFTGGHFFAALNAGTLRMSRDGETWSGQLKIPLGQIGPAACLGRCIIVAGRAVRPPIVLTRPKPPAGADKTSPYYCEFMALHDTCTGCYGATVSSCREGVTCRVACDQAADCPAAKSGNAKIDCAQTQVGGLCMLSCANGETCPDSMTCSGDQCYYVYDDPSCIAP